MRHPFIAIGIASLACGWGLAACDSDSSDSNWHPSPADAAAEQDSGHAGAGGSAGKEAGADAGGQDGAGAVAGAAGSGEGGSAAAGAGGTGGNAEGGSAGAEEGGAGGSDCVSQGGFGPDCSFPQGVPDQDFIEAASSYQDTDPAVDAAVNAVMESLSGCGAMSDCDITGFPGTTAEEICQSWFDAVNAGLREQGFCAGQHVQGNTDEIAVNDTCCAGKWYGYHICNYGGPKVVWNPGARRGWWKIAPSHCP